MEEEIKMEEKNTFDELVNKVTDVKIDETKELLTNKDIREKFINDLDKYLKDIQFEYYLYRDRLEKNRKLDLVIANVNVTNFKSFNIIVNDFRLSARQAIISKKLRSVYLLREEELLKTISDLRAKIDDFDIYSESHSNEEIMENYSNQELTEFSTIRNQSIPMYLIELETLSAGIDANTKTFNEEINMAYAYAMKLLDILVHEELINCVLMNKEEKPREENGTCEIGPKE